MKRKRFLDIAKGILIITVVMGHSQMPYYRIFYWFHMPAFFIISGYLQKAYKWDKESLIKFAKRIISLLVPYIFYLLLVTVGIFLLKTDTTLIDFFKAELPKMFYGGNFLTGYRSVFWFITSMMLTITAFYVVSILQNKFFKDKAYLSYLIIFLLYLIAHFSFVSEIEWPFYGFGAYPTLLITVPYFYLGYYSKSLINNLEKSNKKQNLVLVITFVIIVMSLVLRKLHLIDYFLDIKPYIFTDFILDLIIPATYTLFIVIASMKIQKFKISELLSKIGIASLVIMYLHVNTSIWFGNGVRTTYVLYIFVGIAFPLLVAYLAKFNKITSFLMLGKVKK